ncbi:MAG: ACP S-malonyltransferase [Candidatus Aphodousia sp.]|nr:ACP S-malonyltransferase [Candidatus Aphodousia sp.]
MKLAFVFPGQGSQTVGMLAAFEGNAAVAETMKRADAALGESLTGMIAAGPAEELNLTVNTQPAMLASSVAFYNAWIAAGGMAPEVMAGHSLGEYSALTAAGVFELEDAVRLVRFRAQCMQEAVPVGVGGMAAIIGLSDAIVAEVCQEAASEGIVEAVNFNSPGQVVIAGQKTAVEKACMIAKDKGAKRALMLAVSAPFHSSMMKPASLALKTKLQQMSMKAPSVDVIANVDVTVHHQPEAIIEALAAQAAGAVQWVKTIEAMKAMGVTHIVECGPGRVLAGLIKRIDASIVVKNINSQETLQSVLEELKSA